MKGLGFFTLGFILGFGWYIALNDGPRKDYQLDATPKGYNLYSGSEKIGFIPAGNSTLDSLIQNHNQ